METMTRNARQAPAAAWAGSYTLPNTPTSAALARLLVRQALADCPPELIESAELAASELVTNGIKHAETALVLQIHPASPGFRIIVSDGSAEPPVMSSATTEGDRGRGLQIVDAVASSWGWNLTPTGKQVWFETT